MRKKMHMSGGGNNRPSNKHRRHSGGNKRGGGAGRHSDSDFVSPQQRKHAMNARDRYIGLGKDALSAGDRVEAEYYFQHAEHYLRVINLADEQFQARNNKKAASNDDNGAEADGDDTSVKQASNDDSADDEAPKTRRRAAPKKTEDDDNKGNVAEEVNLEAILPEPKAAQS